LRPRVLHVITGLTTGGAERTLHRLLGAGLARAFSTTVVSLGDRGSLGRPIEGLGVDLFELEMKPGRPTLGGVRRLVRLIRELEPDLIQGWMYHGNLAASAGALLARRKVPVVWNVRHALHDLGREKRSTAAVIRLGRRLPTPARIVYNSRASAGQHARLGYAADRAVVIPNGFDCDEFRPSETARAALRAELGLAPDVRLVGLIARYHADKDHETFLRAAEDSTAGGLDAHFVLAGADIEPANPELAPWLERPGLSGRLHLLGQRDDVADVTAALDLATCSSRTEALPNTVGEAMACGVPCVVSDVGDNRWLVGETGRVVPPEDPVALAESWRRLLQLDEPARRHLGGLARERITEHFRLTFAVRRYEELYEELCR